MGMLPDPRDLFFYTHIHIYIHTWWVGGWMPAFGPTTIIIIIIVIIISIITTLFNTEASDH